MSIFTYNILHAVRGFLDHLDTRPLALDFPSIALQAQVIKNELSEDFVY